MTTTPNAVLPRGWREVADAVITHRPTIWCSGPEIWISTGPEHQEIAPSGSGTVAIATGEPYGRWLVVLPQGAIVRRRDEPSVYVRPGIYAVGAA